jgi:hypothetical protein
MFHNNMSSNKRARGDFKNRQSYEILSFDIHSANVISITYFDNSDHLTAHLIEIISTFELVYYGD